jgi:hypothetical protein
MQLHLEKHSCCIASNPGNSITSGKPSDVLKALAICFIAFINWLTQYHLERHQMGHALSSKASEHYSIVLHMFEANRISISHDVVVM